MSVQATGTTASALATTADAAKFAEITEKMRTLGVKVDPKTIEKVNSMTPEQLDRLGDKMSTGIIGKGTGTFVKDSLGIIALCGAAAAGAGAWGGWELGAFVGGLAHNTVGVILGIVAALGGTLAGGAIGAGAAIKARVKSGLNKLAEQLDKAVREVEAEPAKPQIAAGASSEASKQAAA